MNFKFVGKYVGEGKNIISRIKDGGVVVYAGLPAREFFFASDYAQKPTVVNQSFFAQDLPFGTERLYVSGYNVGFY